MTAAVFIVKTAGILFSEEVITLFVFDGGMVYRYRMCFSLWLLNDVITL